MRSTSETTAADYWALWTLGTIDGLRQKSPLLAQVFEATSVREIPGRIAATGLDL